MRFPAVLLLVALLFPTAAAMSVTAAERCCCSSKAGASCPMKRRSAPCQKPGMALCGFKSAQPASTVTLSFSKQPPIELVALDAFHERTSLTAYSVFDRAVPIRTTQRPEVPPPKRA